MFFAKIIFPLLCLSIQLSVALIQKRDYINRQYYALNIEKSDADIDQLVKQLGATFEGKVGELPHYFLISFPADVVPTHPQHSLVKRTESFKDTSYTLYPQIPSKRLFKRAPPTYADISDLGDWVPNATLPDLREYKGYHRIKHYLQINSPGFDLQWHHINRLEIGKDLNVTGVWSQGITGKGINIAILDDGLDMDHQDLSPNYFPEGSYDFNDRVPEPRPRLSDDTHGTRCAGEIAAVKDGMCGVGVAYDAKVAGVRILSGELTDADEAAAINYAFQKNHIYSCSWGPPDTGEVIQGPPDIMLDAFKNGVEHGRNGSGSIFVFASGNGGTNGDNCNFDGYTNSIYTLTVGAVDRHGQHPSYAEACAAQLMVAYSSGGASHIYTTDVSNQCTNSHGGTSAAAPLAAGILALVLSVRPDLSWRDVQHLCVQSAIPFSLEDPDWADLPSGRKFNHKFGYGVVDAYRIVEMAKQFKSVGEQVSLQITPTNGSIGRIPDITPVLPETKVHQDKAFNNTLVITPEQIQDAQIARVEHVTVAVSIEHQRRGDLEIYLESPNGVVSQLATARKKDESKEGFNDWTFMTVKHWEENPVGPWTLRVIDGKNPQYTGTFLGWKMTLWGEKKARKDNESRTTMEESVSNNSTVKISLKPDIEIQKLENIDKLQDQKSDAKENPEKKISIHKELETSKEKVDQIKNINEVTKEKKKKKKQKQKTEKQQPEQDQELEENLNEKAKPNNLIDKLDHSKGGDGGIVRVHTSKLDSAEIEKLKLEKGASNAFLGEKNRENTIYKSSNISIIFFILLGMTIVCTIFIFKKYVVVSGKINEFMNMPSRNNYELRQRLIQPNESQLN